MSKPQQSEFIHHLTPQRRAIVERLEQRPWWRATSPRVRAQLLALPENSAERNNWNPLIEDLAGRADVVGGVTHVRLRSIQAGNFGALVQFDVKNAAGKDYTYEFFTWKHGPVGGAKGVVYVRRGGKITHVVVLHGQKFAPGRPEPVWDTVGGFADIGADGVHTINQRILVEIREELGVDNLQIAELINLGHIRTDAGMTNNHPIVFAAIIESAHAAKLDPRRANLDEHELESGVVIVPIDQLANLARVNDDSFFAVAILRSIAAGIIPPFGPAA